MTKMRRDDVSIKLIEGIAKSRHKFTLSGLKWLAQWPAFNFLVYLYFEERNSASKTINNLGKSKQVIKKL